MSDHSKDNPLENKSQDHETPTTPELIFSDDSEDTYEFERTISLDSPLISEQEQQSFDSTIQFDSMESLLDEDSINYDTERDSVDKPVTPQPTPESDKPDDDAYDLGINTDELEGLKDFMMENDDEEHKPSVELSDVLDEEDEPSDIHNIMENNEERTENHENLPNDEHSEPIEPKKRIILTEADYAETNTVDAAISETQDIQESADSVAGDLQDEITDNIAETVNELEDAIDSQIISAAAREAHAVQDNLQDKPDITDEDEILEEFPHEKPADPPTSQPRTGMAFGLIGMVGAAGVLWMNITLSDRIDQLEAQKPTGTKNTAITQQNEAIASINRRMDKFAATMASHLAAASKPAPVSVSQPKTTVIPITSAPPVKPSITATAATSVKSKGIWVVNLTSLSDASAANDEVARLKGLGIPAENFKIKTHGKTWYRIRILGFLDKEAAEHQRKVLAKTLGIQDTWIGKR